MCRPGLVARAERAREHRVKHLIAADSGIEATHHHADGVLRKPACDALLGGSANPHRRRCFAGHR